MIRIGRFSLWAIKRYIEHVNKKKRKKFPLDVFPCKLDYPFIDDGNEYPAVGMSFGLVPIAELLTKKEGNNQEQLYDIYVIPCDDDCNVFCLKLADKLRNNGIRVIIEMNHKKIKKAFQWASKNDIPYVVVVGSDEINSNKISIRDMNHSKDMEFSIDDVDKMVDFMRNDL